MSSPRFEAFLARLYVDAELRRRALEDPHAVAWEAGLDAGEADALARIDRAGLALATRSFAAKRAHAPGRRRRLGWLGWLASLTARAEGR